MKKIVKKVLSFLLLILSICCFLETVNVETKATTYNYVDPASELRAVWVTPITDASIVDYTSETSFKTNMEYIFNVLEASNLNTLIFHVRQMNDALYKSDINPVYSGWSKVNFNTFDPLAWLIEECHKRGIEFHAWMNPYRITNSGATSAEVVANKYTSYPLNSASNSDNILVYNNRAILNPGIKEVRDHVVDTVIEFISRYDVDAVHFDDYFYIDLGANGKTSGTTTILDEADNNLYVNFCNNFSGLSTEDKAEYDHYRKSYTVTDALHKADWRRVQCNLFFKQLKSAVSSFNEINNKYIQIGVAPTGIYKNGNGEVTYDDNGWPITDGSSTGGQTHYSSYLFSDTVYWCCKSWIDYIMPQSYWAIDHSVAGYKKVMGWWDKVVKNLDVNLYSGIGLYWPDTYTSTSWYTDSDELYNQLDYLTTLENVSGASLYNFDHLRKHYDGGTSKSALQASHLGTNCWKIKVVQPEIKSINPIHLGKVNNFIVNGKTLTWDRLDNAKFYAIYRSSSEVTFDSSELIDIVGGSNSSFTWTDSDSDNYNYGIRALSYSNTLGEKTIYSLNDKYQLELTDGASVRTTGERQGLKFSATIDTLKESVEHGFLLAVGTHSASEFIAAFKSNSTTVNGNNLIKKVITGSNTTFHVVVYNIPKEKYNQDISVIAYVKYEDSENLGNYIYEFSSFSVTRNILEIAIKAYQDGDTSEFVKEIYLTNVSESITATRYNTSYGNGNYVMLGSSDKAGTVSGLYWDRIFLKYNNELGLYEVVGFLASGIKLSTFTSSYDYIIGVHDDCLDTNAKNLIQSMVASGTATKYYLNFETPTVAGECSVKIDFILK